jgi:hypothetical protein
VNRPAYSQPHVGDDERDPASIAVGALPGLDRESTLRLAYGVEELDGADGRQRLRAPSAGERLRVAADGASLTSATLAIEDPRGLFSGELAAHAAAQVTSSGHVPPSQDVHGKRAFETSARI